MQTCAKCGADNKDGVAHCGSCGAVFVAKKKIPAWQIALTIVVVLVVVIALHFLLDH
jgi:hypothetical protein